MEISNLTITFSQYVHRIVMFRILVSCLSLILSFRYCNGASIFTTSGAAARKFQAEVEVGQVRWSVQPVTGLLLMVKDEEGETFI